MPEEEACGEVDGPKVRGGARSVSYAAGSLQGGHGYIYINVSRSIAFKIN